MDPEQTNKAYMEIVAYANAKIRSETTHLMDLQHEGIQASRQVVQVLRAFQERYNSLTEELINAHRTAVVELAALYGDVIAFEQGLVTEGEEEDEDGEEEGDQDEVPAD